MPDQGITGDFDIADLIYEVLKFNKVPGGDVVAVSPRGMNKVDVELHNGRKYEIHVKRTNPNDVE